MTGYQGEWFDPHDVEHYLRAKGLRLDGLSTWLDLDVNEVPALEATQLNASASPADSYPDIETSNPVNIEPQYLGEPAVHAPERLYQPASLPEAPYMDTSPPFIESLSYSKSAISNLLDDPGTMFSGALPGSNTTPKKVIDVEKFIDREPWPSTPEPGMTG